MRWIISQEWNDQKLTVLAGALTPIANVSVENKTYQDEESRINKGKHVVASESISIASVTIEEKLSHSLFIFLYWYAVRGTLMTPRQKSISTTSLTIGSSPAWCTPMPRRSRFWSLTTYIRKKKKLSPLTINLGKQKSFVPDMFIRTPEVSSCQILSAVKMLCHKKHECHFFPSYL